MRTNIIEVLNRLPSLEADHKIKEWVALFESGNTDRPLLVLSGEPGYRGILQALARSIADRSGRGADSYFEAPGVEETWSLPEGGEVAVIDGNHDLLKDAAIREDVSKLFADVVSQAPGPRWIILIEGNAFRLPAAAAEKALRVAIGPAPVAVS